MLGLLNDGLGGFQRITQHKIRQIRTVQRNRAQKQSLFLGADAQRHSAIVFDSYSWHGVLLYAFKAYAEGK